MADIRLRYDGGRGWIPSGLRSILCGAALRFLSGPHTDPLDPQVLLPRLRACVLIMPVLTAWYIAPAIVLFDGWLAGLTSSVIGAGGAVTTAWFRRAYLIRKRADEERLAREVLES